MYLSIDIVLTIQKFQFRLTCSALILSCHIEYRVLNFSLKTGMKIVICVQLVNNKFHICWKPLKPFDVFILSTNDPGWYRYRIKTSYMYHQILLKETCRWKQKINLFLRNNQYFVLTHKLIELIRHKYWTI